MATKATAGTTATAETALEANSGEDAMAPFDLIPGSDIIGRGIYIRPREPYELKAVLFKQKPNNSILQRYTRSLTNKTYSVPEGCAVNPSPPLPADQSFGQTLIEESWSRFSKQLSMNAAASASGKSFSIDASAFQANSVKSDQDSYYALRSSFVPLWDLYMPSIPDTLSKVLEDQIPKKSWEVKDDEYEFGFDWSNRDKYAEIFNRYGTHFVKNVWVGGKASLVFTVAKSSDMNKNEVSAAVQASLGGLAKGSVSVEQKTSLENFSSKSSCKVFGNGGDGLVLAKLSGFDNDAYNEWLQTVEKVPAVIQLGVAGIWTLIKDKNKAEVLKEAYMQETRFVPLTAIVPIDKYYLFLKDSWGFVIEYLADPYKSTIKTLSTVEFELTVEAIALAKQAEENAKASVETGKADADTLTALSSRYLGMPLPQKPDSRLKLETLEKFFCFFKDEFRFFSRPDAALSFYALGQQQNTILLFKHKKCLLVNFEGYTFADLKPDPGYPMDISKVFPGVDVDRVDAALVIPPNKIYIFSGPDYYRIDVGPDSKFAPAVKAEIINGWPGVDFERLDTATYWKNGKVYFFYEDQYIRYDVSNHRADTGYPKQLTSNYVEDWDFFD